MITVLGAPVALGSDVVAILGEISRRAKAAYGAHKAMLQGPGSHAQKLTAYGRFVTPSALWAVGAAHPHDALLKGANTLQLLQLRQMLGVKRRLRRPAHVGHTRSYSTPRLQRTVGKALH